MAHPVTAAPAPTATAIPPDATVAVTIVAAIPKPAANLVFLEPA
jgi:hypothetical protein